jgi:ADP-ribosylglycohydrolase
MKTLGEMASNDSKGCGGVMRVAPVGFFTWRLKTTFSYLNTFSLGSELAALTHGHPTGALTAGVFSVLIYALIDGATLPEALIIAKACLCSVPHHEETLSAIELAEQLTKSNLPHEIAIAELGHGWIAEEALAISIYCALVSNNFEQGVVMAVNHDGDSDSTGAIVGNLLGTMYGVNAIPEKWLSCLELRDVITELAKDLYDFPHWDIGENSKNKELSEQIWQKYPGC